MAGLLGFILVKEKCPSQIGRGAWFIVLTQGSTISNVVDCWVGDKKKALEGLPFVILVHWPELATCPTHPQGAEQCNPTLYLEGEKPNAFGNSLEDSTVRPVSVNHVRKTICWGCYGST